MEFLNNPYLPEKKLKCVAIGESNEEISAALNNLCVKTITLQANNSFIGSLSTHADMLMINCGDGDFIVDNKQTNVQDYLNDIGASLKTINFPDICKYPDDVALNAAIIGNYVICNEKFVDKRIVENKKIINVSQGYSKCSVCPVTDKAMITDDISVFKTVSEFFDVLLIDKGSIKLKGFDYGFFGGSAFKIDKNVLALTGKLSSHSDYIKIQKFLYKYNISVIELTQDGLIDIGGIVPIY